ncbi:MAG: hypothetical protein ACRDUA_19370 [Micromonosporaceae bacterium]
MVRCALVVRYDTKVDEELLATLAEETGAEFGLHASGMFGTEVLGTFYSDEDDNLPVDAKAVEVPC